MTIQDSVHDAAAKPQRFRWFAAGGLTVAVVMAGFLYTTGYFDNATSGEAEAGDSRNIIESKK